MGDPRMASNVAAKGYEGIKMARFGIPHETDVGDELLSKHGEEEVIGIDSCCAIFDV